MTNIVRKIQFETSTQVQDAITFMSACQAEILDLFDLYDQSSEKKVVATQICRSIMVAISIEEEIFHPAVKKAVKEYGSLSAAIMEHSILKYLVSEIEGLDEDSSIYDIKIHVLGEHVKDNFMSKQIKIFPKIAAANKIDLWAIGMQLALGKQELAAAHGYAAI